MILFILTIFKRAVIKSHFFSFAFTSISFSPHSLYRSPFISTLRAIFLMCICFHFRMTSYWLMSRMWLIFSTTHLFFPQLLFIFLFFFFPIISICIYALFSTYFYVKLYVKNFFALLVIPYFCNNNNK